MTDQRTFAGVTSTVWEQIKAVGQRQYGTVFDPPEGNAGQATTPTPFGDVVLAYVLDPAGCSITYTIERKPLLIPAGLIWSGIESTIDHCSHEA